MRMTLSEAQAFSKANGIDLGLDRPASPRKKKDGFKGAPSRSRRRDPQAELLFFARQRWGDIIESEFKGAVPGRRFRLDMAIADLKIAIEVDGWQYHGKHKADFHRDREKRNLLAVEGWAVLAFSARDIFKDPDSVLDIIQSVVELRAPTAACAPCFL